MCLTIDQNLHEQKENGYFEPKIADRDMVVFKILIYEEIQERRFIFGGVRPRMIFEKRKLDKPVSYFRENFSWSKDEVYKTEFSFETQVEVSSLDYQSVKKGFHAFTSETGPDYLIFPDAEPNSVMVIPKGAKYYIGEDNDIVANKMKYVGKIEEVEVRRHEDTGHYYILETKQETKEEVCKSKEATYSEPLTV
jgi:hypothetical protein